MKKPSRREVRITRADSLLTIRGTLPEDVRRSLVDALTYSRRVFLRGREAAVAGVNIRMEPVGCYNEETDPDNILPPQMHTPEGYLDIVVAEFNRHGYNVSVVNRPSHGRIAKLKPVWSQVEDAEWKYKQKRILELMLKEPIGRFSCPPGYGKSWLIGQFCKLTPKAQIDITTTSADVIRQLYEYLQSLGLPSVGLVGAGKRVYDKRVTCYCGKSLSHSRKKADVLIVDELHEFGTDAYLSELAEYNSSKRFGFSASHDLRPDGADFELLGLFGPILLEMTYPEAVEHKCVVPMEVNWNSVLLPGGRRHYANTMDRERYGIWQNRPRNKLIAGRARHYEKHGDQVLVIVSKVEHAMHLKRELPDFTLCHGELEATERQNYINEGLIPDHHPSMTLERRLVLTRAFREGKLKKVIATGVWNRGVDFRRLGVLVRADAMASPIADIQIPGRLSRTAEEAGKEVGIVEDFMDQFDDTLKGRAGKRRASYKTYGWTQHSPSRKRLSSMEQTYLFT